MTDLCNILNIKNYKPSPLTSPVSVEGNIYTFVDSEKTYKIELTWSKENSAIVYVNEITCNGCVSFKDNYQKYQYIKVEWNKDTIEILGVYLGDAKGQRLCSKSVAYCIRVLLMVAEKQNKYPSIGKVEILSKTFCAAASCYIHAFQANGFEPDDENLRRFVDKVNKRTEKRLSFVLYLYKSHNDKLKF